MSYDLTFILNRAALTPSLARVISRTDLRPAGMPSLVQGVTLSCALYFVDADGNYTAESGSADVDPRLVIAYPGAEPPLVAIEADAFTTITNGWTFELPLTSEELNRFLVGLTSGRQSWLEINYTDSDDAVKTVYRAEVQLLPALYDPEATYYTYADLVQAVENAQAAETAAAADALATAADRVQTGLDRTATGEDATATAADRVQTGLDRVATGEDATATAADRVQTGLDRVATGEDATATAADRVQTGLDRVATGEDATATAADRVQTGLDRIATGEDATATSADRVATGEDAAATAADRVQTGTDAATATTKAAEASASATTALNAIAQAFKGGIAGASVPATSPLAGDTYRITTAGTSQSITWAVGDAAIYNGTSGSWTKLPGYFAGHEALTTEYAAPRAPRQGIISTGATFGAQTAVSPAFGTDDLTIGMWVRLPDWTPGSTKYLVSNQASSNGAGFSVSADAAGVFGMRLYNGASSTTVTSDAHGIADNSWAFITFAFDRDANVTVSVNGSLLSTIDISALSAGTWTGSALYWLAYTTASLTAGTLGECFIAQGALTAAQIAAIAKAGTAVGAGLTTYQHLVPSDSLGIGIFEDVSGNANHAVLGATGISTVLPIDLPADAPAQALVGDGTSGSFVRAMTGDQSPGDDEFALAWEFETDGGIHSLVLATEAAVSTIPGLFRITYGANTSIMRVDVFGATTNDYNRWEAGSVLPNLAGKKRHVMVVRNASGTPTIYLGSAGQAYDITNLGVFTSNGTAPTWQAAVPGNYIVKQAGAETTADIALLNTAPTLADFEYRVRNGRWHEKFAKGSKAQNTQPFAGTHTLSGESASGFNAVSATVAFLHTSTLPNIKVVAGTKIRFTYTLVVNSGARPRLELARPGVINLGYTQLATVGTNTVEMTANAGSAFARISFTTTGASDFTVSDASVEILGLTTALDLQDGGGYQPKNPRAENGSTHWTMSTTGIKWAAPNRVPKTIIADLAASTSAQQITGASVIPVGWEILRIRAKAASGTPNIIIGNVSGGTQVVTSEALSTSWKALTIAGGIHITSTANLWATLDSAVAVDLEFDIQPRGDL